MSTISTHIGKGTPCLFDEILPRYIWGADSKTKFSKSLDSDLTVEKFRTLLTDEPVYLAKETTNLLLDNAKTCNLKSTKERNKLKKANRGLTRNVRNKKIK